MVDQPKPDPNKTTPPHQVVKPDPHAPTPVVGGSPVLGAAKGRGRPGMPVAGDEIPVQVGDETFLLRVVDSVAQGGQGVVVLADADKAFRDAVGMSNVLGVHDASPFAVKIGSEIKDETSRVPLGPPPPRHVAALRMAGECLVDGRRYECAVGRYYSRGSIAHEIGRSGPMPVDQAACVASAALSGLLPLHDAGRIHGDVKPANLLTSKLPSGDTSCAVADFGSAFDTAEPQYGIATTIGYASERLLRLEGGYNQRDDLYAVGVSLAAMIRGEDQSLVSRTIVGASPWRGGNSESKRLLADLQPTYLRTGHPVTDHVVARLISPDPRDQEFDGIDALACLFPLLPKGAREPEQERDRLLDDVTVDRIADRVLERLDPSSDRHDPTLVPLLTESAHHLAATSSLSQEQRQDLRHAAMASEEACIAAPANAAAERWLDRTRQDNAARLNAAEKLRDPTKPSYQLDAAHRAPIRPAKAPRNPVVLPDRGP